MNDALLLMTGFLPLLLATLAGQRHARWLLPIGALPGLLTAAVVPVGSTVSLPWLLLGSELGIDETGRVFLAFSSLLWLLAAVTVAGGRDALAESRRFRVFFLFAMAGNFTLIVAGDMVSFYLGFALMGLSAYGLVAQSPTRRARLAARTYLAWTIAGELLLFAAIVQLAAGSGGALTFDALQAVPRSPLVMLLLITGFGIKLALPLLHWWLPPVYAVTPAAALAVFSGVMIKAGLLGGLRFFPPGEATPAGWGMALIAIGVATLVFGVIAGLLQTRPRLLLGYSSISKMGVLTTGLGAALVVPAAATGIVAALLVYAANHALAKTALFLGLGLVERGGLRLSLLLGLGFLAAVLAGAPLTGGALAKSALDGALSPAIPVLVTLLTVSTVATTLLMVRFLHLLCTRRRRALSPLPAVPVSAWLGLVALVTVLPFLFTGIDRLAINIVPVALGLVLGLVVIRIGARMTVRRKDRRRHARGRKAPLRPPVTLQEWLPVVSISRVAQVIDFERARVARGRLERSWLYSTAARRALVGVVWLGITGALLGGFAASA